MGLKIFVFIITLFLLPDSLFAQDCTLPIGGDRVWCAGSSSTFRIHGADRDSVNYAWTLTGLTDSGTVTTVLADRDTTVRLSGLPAGQYRLNSLVTHLTDTISRCQLNLNVSAPDSIPIQVTDAGGLADNDGRLCLGDSLRLIAAGLNDYAWSTGDTTATIDYTPFVPGPDSLTLTATDTNGCVAVGSFRVVVDTAVTVELSVIDSSGLSANDGRACLGDSVTISAPPGYAYGWGTATGDTTNAITVAVLNEDTVNVGVRVTDGYGCRGQADVSVSGQPLPRPRITAQEFSGTEDDGRVCLGSDVALLATGGDSYLWSTAATTEEITVTSDTAVTRLIGLTATLSGCEAGTVREIQFYQPPIAGIGPLVGNHTVNRLLAISDESEAGDGTIERWSWVFGPAGDVTPHTFVGSTPPGIRYVATGAKEITLDVTDRHGCTASDTSRFDILGENSCQIIGGLEDRTVCPGERFTLMPVTQIAGTGITSWEWSFPEGIEELRDSTGSNPSMIINTAGSFEFAVRFTDNLSPGACTSPEVRFTYTVEPLADPTLTLVGSGNVCANGTAELLVTGLPDGQEFDLRLNDNRQYVVRNTSIVSVRVGAGGREQITVQSIESTASGCQNRATTGSVEITVTPRRDVVIDDAFARPCPGGELVLDVLDADDYTDFVWFDPGGTQTATPGGRFVGPAIPGIYRITARDGNGCTGQGRVDVDLRARPQVQGIEGMSEVCGNQRAIYVAPAPAGSVYRWTVSDRGAIIDTLENGIQVEWGSDAGPASVSVVVEATPQSPRDACTSDPVSLGVEVSPEQAPAMTEVVLISQRDRDYFLVAANQNACYQWGSEATGPLEGETFRTLFLGDVEGGPEAILSAGYYVETWNGDCTSEAACRNQSFYQDSRSTPDPMAGKLSLEVFPNPVHTGNDLQFRIAGSTPGGAIRLLIYGVGGRLIASETRVADNVGEVTSTIPTANLPNGYYHLRILEREGGGVAHRAVIITR